MSLILNLFYLLLIIAAAPWLLYGAWRHGKYREGLEQKLLGRVPPRDSDRPCIWFHAVSVGEVNLLRTLVDCIEDEFPGWEVAISTTTKTGYELARKRYAENLVFYCPLDFSWSVREALSRIRPTLLVLAELELWPNLIWAARRGGCPVAIFNGRLSEKSFRGYGWIRPLVARLLRNIDLVAAQNDEYADRFRRLGAANVCVTGSVKFDGAQTDRSNLMTQCLWQLADLEAQDVVFLAGSTQAPEERLAIATYRDLYRQFPRLKMIIAPRHTTRSDEIALLLNQSGFPWQRRSDFDKGKRKPGARILLVDTIGELAAWWGTAQIAFVGGSLGSRGGQNMIEPAGYGAAVCFGPNTRNFRDVVSMLLKRHAAVVVHNGQELTAFVRMCLEQPALAGEIGQRARQVVLAQQGATERTIGLLSKVVTASRLSRPRAAA